MPHSHPVIKTAHSTHRDTKTAVRDFVHAVTQPDMALVVFFCSREHDLDILASEMARHFPGVAVVGCTTAGEIGPGGYLDRTLTGASFPSGMCTAVTTRLGDISRFSPHQSHSMIQELLGRLESTAPASSAGNTFAFMLIDGLSRREELVTRALQVSLGDISLVGGSAGDGLSFVKTHVYHDGQFHSDCVVLTLLTTRLPFRIFKTQHFSALGERLVITSANTANRTVMEINGRPAAEEYARLTGVSADRLNPAFFARSPVVVLIDGTEYVRSIQRVNPDGSLTFYCAIEEGLVFRPAVCLDIVRNLEQTFDDLRRELGPLQFVMACDCVLRNIEISQAGLKHHIERIFRDNNTVGFGTYGEQYRGIHVNQTLTGIAFGEQESPYA